MKNLSVLLILSLVCTIQATAEKVSEQQAREIAGQFFPSGNSRLTRNITTAPLQLAYSSNSYYVFNRSENAGFVIVAADDRFSNPILGFSNEGTFDTTDIPDGMNYWLGEYDRLLEWAETTGYIPTEETTTPTISKLRNTRSTRANIAPPTTQVKWGQDAPYNANTPSNYPTGCVATALAQILYYKQYPTSSSYNSYNYSAMDPTYNSNSSATEVAKLMADIGTAVGMSYAASESAATNINAVKGMIDNFGFNKGASLLVRGFYSDEEWIDMLYNELAKNGPIFYAGKHNNGGHAFVCEGYKYENGTDYFYFNFGWDGRYNGYFQINAINPIGSGTGGGSGTYNLDQEALFNFFPNTDAEASSDYAKLMYNTTANFGIHSDYNPADLSSTKTRFTGAFVNYSAVDQKFTRGLMVIDSEDNITWVEGPTDSNTRPSYGTSSGSMDVSLANAFPSAEGKYTVFPAYKDEKGNWQKMHTWALTTAQGRYIPYLEAQVSGTTVTFSTPALDATINPTTGYIEALAREEVTVTYNITNSTKTTYSKELSFSVLNYDYGTVISTHGTQTVTLEPGESKDIAVILTMPNVTGQTYYKYNAFVDGVELPTAYRRILCVSPNSASVSYTVTFGSSINGSFKIKNGTKELTTGSKVPENTTLTVETTPAEGFIVDQILVNGSAITGNTFTVTQTTNVEVTFKDGSTVTPSTTPTPSTDTELHYYLMRASRGTNNDKSGDNGLCVTYNSSSELEGTTTITDECYWRFELRDDGSYDIINENGYYVDPTSGSSSSALKITATRPTTTGWTFTESQAEGISGYYRILSGEASFNQTASEHNYKIFSWGNRSSETGSGDYGCAYRFEFVKTVTIQSYTLTYGETANGSFKVMNGTIEISNGQKVAEGTTLTISVTADTGYEIDEITVTGTTVSTSNTFVMPGNDVTVTVTFKAEESGGETTTVDPYDSDAYCSFATATATTTTGEQDRYLSSITLTNATTQSSTTISDIETNKVHTIFHDETSSKIVAKAGETINISVNHSGNGNWIHCYTYVDYNKDGAFSDGNTDRSNAYYPFVFESNAPKTGSELVSFTFYSPTESASGWNSKGESLSNNPGFDNIPSFTIPTNLAPGDYRVRFNITWNELDPCGELYAPQDNDATANRMDRCGGSMTDFILTIEESTPVQNYAITFASTTNGSFKVMNGTTEISNGQEVAEGTTLTVVTTADSGYELDQIAIITGSGTSSATTVLTDNTFEVTQAATVSVSFKEIVVTPEVDKSVIVPEGKYQFYFDDIILGSHTNNNGNQGDQRIRNFTMSAWVKPLNITSGTQIMGHGQKDFNNAAGSFGIWIENGKFRLKYRSWESGGSCPEDVNPTTDATVSVDTWTFLTIAIDDTNKTITLYQDGNLVISSPIANNGIGLLADECVFFIGNGGFACHLDEAQVWNKALSANEVKTSMFGYTEAPAELIAYYNFTDNEATALNNKGIGTATPGAVRQYGTSSWGSDQTASYAEGYTYVAPTPSTQHTVTINQPTAGGSITVLNGTVNITNNSQVEHGTILTIVPEEAVGYELKEILVNGTPIIPTGTSNNYTHTLNADATITATFTKKSYPVTINQPTTGGSITVTNGTNPVGIKVEHGTTLTITPSANSGYELNQVLVNDSPITADENGAYTCIVTRATTITATFAQRAACTVTITTPVNGTISVVDEDNEPISNGDKLYEGSVLTIEAIPAKGYELESLTVDGVEYTGPFVLNSDVTIAASFIEEEEEEGETPVEPVIPAEDGLAYGKLNMTFDGSTEPFLVPTDKAAPILAASEVTIAIHYTLPETADDYTSEVNPLAFTGAVNSTLTSYDVRNQGDYFAAIAWDRGSSFVIGTKMNDNNLWFTRKEGDVNKSFTGEHKLVIVCTATDNFFYLDGVSIGSSTEGTNSYPMVYSECNGLDQLYIGGFKVNNSTVKYPFNGDIHSIRFYTKTMSANEVAALNYDFTPATQYTVTFDQPQNGTIKVLNGTTEITTGSKVTEGTELTITATANEGYTLIDDEIIVNEDIISNGETYTVNSDITAISANFAINTYTVTINDGGANFVLESPNAENPIAGTELNDGDYSNIAEYVEHGTELTLVINFAEGKKVNSVTWTIGSGTKAVSTTLTPTAGNFTQSSVYTFEVTNSGTLTIHTEDVTYSTPTSAENQEYTESYVKTLALSANDASWQGFSLNLHPSTSHNMYLDNTQVPDGKGGFRSLPVNTGSIVTITITYEGNAINNQYLYVDWNKDGDFTDNGELVYPAPVSRATSDATFTVPDNLIGGMYRARFEVDNDSENPNTLEGVVANGTMATDFMMTVTNTKSDLPTDLEEMDGENTILYYTDGTIYSNVEDEIVIYDMTGKPVRREQLAPVNVSDLARGIYIVKAGGKTLKFVK